MDGTRPIENIIIQRLDNAGMPSGTMMIKIPPTTAEHNMITALLMRLRIDYPGAWYCVQRWEREQFSGPITTVEPKKVVAKVKAVTAEQLGLTPEKT